MILRQSGPSRRLTPTELARETGMEQPPDLVPYTLKIQAGADLYVENSPPGERSSHIATDVHVPVWVRREDVWKMDHLLRFWNAVAVERSEG